MAQLTVLIAGLLLLAESQASDVVEQGFLSKQQDAANYNQFILPAVSNVKIGNGPHALSYHNNLAEHSSAVPEMSANSFTIIDDKDVNSGMEQPTEIPIFSAIGVGLLAFVTMLGARDLLVYFIQRSLQPVDMSAGSSDNITEMSSQGPGVGWGQQSSLNSRPLTLCYATPPSGHATDEAPEGTYLGTPGGPFDPLGLYKSSARKAARWHGTVAAMQALGGSQIDLSVPSMSAAGMPPSMVSAVTELIVAELLYLNYESPSKPVTLYINSSGTTNAQGQAVGFETEVFPIADCMKYIKPPVQTICVGL